MFANKSTFMHLADTFIQSSSQGLSLRLLFFLFMLFLGIEPMTLALLMPCYTVWATGIQLNKDLACNKALILWDFIILLFSFNIKQKSIALIVIWQAVSQSHAARSLACSRYYSSLCDSSIYWWTHSAWLTHNASAQRWAKWIAVILSSLFNLYLWYCCWHHRHLY